MAEPTCDELRQQLADMEEAVRLARLGQSVESIRSGSKIVTYRGTGSITEMLRELYRLRGLVADCDGTFYARRRAVSIIPSDSGKPRGPFLRRRG